MTGNIISQRNKTVFNKVQSNSVNPETVQPALYVPSSSYLAPQPRPAYADVVFRDSLATPTIATRTPTQYTVLTYGKTPGPSGGGGGITPVEVSYFDIENNSTYFEEVGGSTYYIVQ